MGTEDKLLILVDGSSYLYRAFHALPPLTNSRGKPTGAVYGVISMLRKILAEYSPDYVAMVFDAKGKNFRHDLYPAYKATRPPMADDLKIQIEPLFKIIEAMGIKLLSLPGIEADDIIGTLAKMAERMGATTIISTGDKDMAQLVGPNIKLINTMNDTQLDVAGVREKFGVTPRQIVDYLVLVGDTSDNIPGVTGVGPKTAARWLGEYDTLDNIIGNLDRIKGKAGDNLRMAMDKFPLTKQLVTIKDNLILHWQLEDLSRKSQRTDELISLFTELEFRNWLKNLSTDNAIPRMENNYKVILEADEFSSLVTILQKARQFAFDVETTSLDIMNAELVGISFAVVGEGAFYIPLAHSYEEAPRQLSRDYVLRELSSIFIDADKSKLGQNIKYDISVLANCGVEVRGKIHDTMVEAYVIDSSQGHYDKKSLALRYLGRNIASYEDMVGKGAQQIPFSQLAIEQALPYAAFDADLVLQLHEILWSELEKNRQQDLCLNLELPLVKVLSRMERCGVVIDCDFLNGYSLELGDRLRKLEREIYLAAGTTFNINSPQQLQEILYVRLGLPRLQKTPKGKPSTAEGVLQELALDYFLPKLILEYRGLTKLKSTYSDALPRAVNPKTGRIHTSYNQAVTTTGRLSSTNPNLQNIPIRTEEGKLIRKAFVAKPGAKIIAADYSQIELRIMAHLAKDENLMKALRRGEDIHRLVAAEIFNLLPEDVTENDRRNAKAINFGLIYGMSAFGLAKRLGISRMAAERYMERYFQRYPRVGEYMQKIKEFAYEHGYVESIFGRRLYLPDIRAKHFVRRQAAERLAINAPIQGSAADIIKLAMIAIDDWIDKMDGDDVTMIMQVHDELVFEVSSASVTTILAIVREKMERVANLDVPLVVTVGIGDNWGEAH